MGSLSVVIPVFNAAESLENLCDQLIRALEYNELIYNSKKMANIGDAS